MGDIHTSDGSARLQPQIWMYEEPSGWSRLSDSSEAGEGWPAISRDGEWLAFAAGNEWEGIEVYLRPLGRPGPVRQVSIGGGTEPRWSPDGEELLYRDRTDVGGTRRSGLMSVRLSFDRSDPERVNIARPTRLFETDRPYIFVTPIAAWDVAPDGRFLFIRAPSPEAQQDFYRRFFPDRLRLIQNWAARLQPTRPAN